METALVGLAGIIPGVFLNELLRRRRRIEFYSQKIFEKRLELYERLFALILNANAISLEIVDDKKLTTDQRHTIWSEIVLEITKFCDANAFYLNQDISVHVMAMLMGVDEIPDMGNVEERRDAINRFRENSQRALRMIRQESGVEKSEHNYKAIFKPKYTGEIIAYFRSEKKKQGIE